MAVVYVVISNSLEGSDGGDEKKERGGDRIVGCEPEFDDAVEDGYYVVQQDDLLSLIAQRTCVPVDELQQLNPETDPQALVPGTCLKLELGGCENREA
ncbi:MAG: LysM peptidoglycan-binding domain-containing protein [Solirubrobacterales bacterium]